MGGEIKNDEYFLTEEAFRMLRNRGIDPNQQKLKIHRHRRPKHKFPLKDSVRVLIQIAQREGKI